MSETHVIFGSGPLGRWTANALLDMGKTVRMVNRTGVMIDPPTVSTPICFLVRGRAYYELGDYGRAIEDLGAALEFAASVEAYYYRGLAYQANGQVEEAIGDFERCIQLHTSGDGMDAEVEDARARLAQLQD